MSFITQVYNIGIDMYFIKALLSPRSRSQQESRVQQIFSLARVQGSGTLHPEYLKILNRALLETSDPTKCIKLLISKLQTLNSLVAIVKCLTMIHRLMISNNYHGPIMECIENAEIIISRELKLEEGQQCQKWFSIFYKAYIRYLVKVSSNAEILVRAGQQIPYMQSKTYLNDFFRLVNQLNIILTPFNNTTKIVGRYYSKKLKVFDELYSVLQTELLSIYKYFSILIESILKNYTELSLDQLETFLIAIPEYQLMLDKLQEIVMCKYFKGANKFGQPYVSAQDIAKISYHIQCKRKLNDAK